ncbi:unnamed protein product [Phytophthora lilii]|uniref:Unnamed protein product n=1 Tax=Phytophthora lilii TaxID=2077276 RepID=A0A9W6X900_9STRA|nr:unnamed protein product [Phytophthora lilii]
MAGDVASTFRNVIIHSGSVRWFGGFIEKGDALIIKLSCPFDWTGSPEYYEIVGGAITHTLCFHTNADNPMGSLVTTGWMTI